MSISKRGKPTSNNITEADDFSLRSLSSEDVSQAPRGYCCAKSINPADGRGRKLHLLQMLILPFIPILALIIQTSVLLNNIMTNRNEVIEIDSQVKDNLLVLYKLFFSGCTNKCLLLKSLL